MVCIECGEVELVFDERVGERVCTACGLVEITEAFEQSVAMFSNNEVIHSADFSKTLGTMHRGKYQRAETNIQIGLVYCNLVLSSIMVNHPLRDRVEECYISLFRGHVFNNLYSYETRATALVYYVLKENNIPIRLKEVRKEFDCDLRKVNKLTRKIATHFGNSGVYAKDNTISMLDKTAREISDNAEFLSAVHEYHITFMPMLEASNFTKGRTYCAALGLIVSTANCMQLTQREIAMSTGYDISSIRQQAMKILNILGYSKLSKIKGKTASEIIGE